MCAQHLLGLQDSEVNGQSQWQCESLHGASLRFSFQAIDEGGTL
jgi:hypothetical protein